MRRIFAAAFFLVASPAPAIDWCHDYTQSTITGSDSKGVNQTELRGALEAGGYEPMNVGNIPRGEVDKRLQPGDIVIFGAAHSGVVGKDGKITHYLQQRDSEGRLVAVDPGKIKKQPTFHRNTFEEIKYFTRDNNGTIQQPYNNSDIKIYRPPRKLTNADRARMRDQLQRAIDDAEKAREAARNAARDAAQNAAKDAARTAVRGATKPPVPHMHHAHSRPRP